MGMSEVITKSVTFSTIRGALTDMYFAYDGMTEEEFKEYMKYVVPMQHNWQNPLNVTGAGDTYIQYWIDSDTRITQDWNDHNENKTLKLAQVRVRFIGKEAELWAKLFHHVTKRKQIGAIFNAYCNATMLEYVGPIVPINIDYFGTANATKAFNITFRLQYEEVLDFTSGSGGGILRYISFPSGNITVEN